MSKIYIVKKGDTLSRIAAAEQVDRQELAALNGITNINFIRVGQRLVIPSKSLDVSPDELSPLPLSAFEPLSYIACQFVDAASKPIDKMRVRIEAGQDATEHITDESGLIPAIAIDPKDVVKVAVKKPSGEWKHVSEIKPDAPATHARILSPKIKASAELQLHDGPIQTAKTSEQQPPAPGVVKTVRDNAGHPVQHVALECPNADNLRLGDNAKYRDIIVEASRRTNLSVHSVAAIMNAEAAKIVIATKMPIIDKKTGKQRIGKDGKPRFSVSTTRTEEWDPHSANKRSSARGMTQFLDGSWISMALTNGTYLNKKVKEEGWLTSTTKHIKRGKKMVEKTFTAFKLENGTLITASTHAGLDKVLSSRPYLTAWGVASDSNIQKLLDLRYVPAYAINTAVDYGVQNLAGLADAGFKVNTVLDGEKAKLIYLAHHLGLSDAQLFIQNKIDEPKAQALLEAQVGEDDAERRSDECDGKYVRAHREWLSRFVDRSINIYQHMCSKQGPQIRGLIDITIAIR